MTATKPRAYLLVAIASPAIILCLWAVAASQGWIRAVLLPSPATVLQSFQDIVVNGYSGSTLATHLAASLARVVAAFVVGSILGTAIGLLRSRSPIVDALFLVPGEVLRPIPPMGLIPLFILWFGIGETSKVLLILVSVFLITMVNAHAGARSCPLEAVRAAQSCGASRLQIFGYVIFPCALPQIMTGLRIAFGTGLSILVAAELLGGDRGLGFVVLDAANFFKTSYVFAGVILIGLLGLASDRLLVWVTHRVVHWQGRQ